eukprot:1223832-Pleurochrysis_carterae.AAC.1
MEAFITCNVKSQDDTSLFDKYTDSVEESGPLINPAKDKEVRRKADPRADARSHKWRAHARTRARARSCARAHSHNRMCAHVLAHARTHAHM